MRLNSSIGRWARQSLKDGVEMLFATAHSAENPSMMKKISTILKMERLSILIASPVGPIAISSQREWRTSVAYKVITNTKELSREDWLKIRKSYIGGSAASAVYGLIPWRSTLDVWMEKRSDEVRDEPSYRMMLGNKLEQTVADLFEEKTGKKVRRNNQMMVSEEHPFMLADIDREIVGEEAILECKATSGWSRDQWKDGMVPIGCQLQVQHYMAVTGASLAYVACMIGFEDFVIREVERDKETIGLLVDFEKRFYEGLKDPNWMPDPDGSSAYTEALRLKYSRSMANDEPVTSRWISALISHLKRR